MSNLTYIIYSLVLWTLFSSFFSYFSSFFHLISSDLWSPPSSISSPPTSGLPRPFPIFTGTLDRSELNFFLKGDTSLDGATITKPLHMDWLLDSGWKDLIKLQSLNLVFKNLLDDITKEATSKDWRDWYDLEDPENVNLPCNYKKVLSPMQELLVLRCFRPDRVYNAVKLFIITIMGDRYVQPPTLDYERVFKQSNADTPVIFVLSPGADPQSSIEKLADEKNFINKFKFLSLGQGQDKAAEAMMTAGANRGHWVLLQNCHLLSSW